MMLRLLVTILVVLGLGVPGGAAPVPAPSTLDVATPLEAGMVVTTATTTFSDGLQGELERIAASHEGRMGISVRNLKTGETFEVNGDAEFVTASTIKTAVMCVAFDHLTSPSSGLFQGYFDSRPYDPATSASGSGFLRNFVPGTRVELKELVHFMITVSDNTATNILTEWLGGPAVVNDWLAAKGLARTRLNSTVGAYQVWNPALRAKWGMGVTTPNEMRRLMEMIHNGTAVASTTATEEMLRVLGHQYFDDVVASQVPPTVWVGSKSGSVNASRSDVALVASPSGMLAMAFYTDNNADRRWTPDNAGERAIQRAARAVWTHYNPDDPWAPIDEKTAAEPVVANAEGARNAPANKSDGSRTMEKATFGAGCFWGVEETFRKLPGVAETAVGYMGGKVDNPTYEQVCTDRTGHAEVVQVVFDPAVTSYEKLLETFWSVHNPTTLNRQGPDIGTQYRSVIFTHTPQQAVAAQASKAAAGASGRWNRPIVTLIEPAGEFWRAEEYHQKYLMKRGADSCGT